TNVLLYGSLVSAGDALQQRLQGREANWRQTRRVATLVVTFHANFNYVWLGLLERALPGRAPHAVLAKLLCDQVVGAPIAVSAFYVELSPAPLSPYPAPKPPHQASTAHVPCIPAPSGYP
ncbi:T0192564 isoform 3, partial [Pan troglodytes]